MATRTRPITTRLANQIRLARKRSQTNRRWESRLRAEGAAKAYETVMRWMMERMSQ